eukprot:14754828-Heterocapsa_arctica.AAC.1
MDRIRRLVDERDSSCYTESEEEAARALLRAKAGYGEAESDLSPYVKGKISLPETNVGAPMATDVLEGEDRDVLV